MDNAIIEIIFSTGYLGVALLIFAENIFPPIPSEAILLFGGFCVASAGLNPWLVILAATAGSLAGAAVLYGVGRFFGKERLKHILGGKVGKALRFRTESIDRAEERFCKYRYKAVFFFRCVPVIRSVISIPAGMSKMPLAPFASLTVLGSTVWNTAIVWLGVAAGGAWEQVAARLGAYSKILFYVPMAITLLIYIVKRLCRKKGKDSA